MTEAKQIHIGDYLLTRLRECGIESIFGVPGDFNLPLLEQLMHREDLRWVGNCNELNAAYAADGYARKQGAGALIVTYGVGDLSAINGIAGSFAEHVPVVCISGIPPLHAVRKRMLLHHTSGTGNLEDVLHAMAQFTAAQSRITPGNVAAEIDRVLCTAMREKRPVYLQIPSDIFEFSIPAPTQPLDLVQPQPDPRQLARVVDEIEARLAKAKQPVLLVDADVQRFGLRETISKLGEARGIPFTTLTSGRSIFDEQHPLYRGIYGGDGSPAAELVEGSDCLLAVGVRFFDATTGIYTHEVDEHNMILIDPFSVSFGERSYEGVTAESVLDALIARSHCSAGRESIAPRKKALVTALAEEPQARLTHKNLWPRMQQFLRSGDVILAEAGTSFAGISGISLPSGVDFISQSLWGSIGFTLPATLGLMMAEPARRHLLFIGDGSLQMTAQEISTMVREGCKPVLFVVNNDGYTIERMIYGPQSGYNDIHRWNYGKLVELFDPAGKSRAHTVRTVGELDAVLNQLEDPASLTIVELMMERMDAPQNLVAMGKRCAEFDFGA